MTTLLLAAIALLLAVIGCLLVDRRRLVMKARARTEIPAGPRTDEMGDGESRLPKRLGPGPIEEPGRADANTYDADEVVLVHPDDPARRLHALHVEPHRSALFARADTTTGVMPAPVAVASVVNAVPQLQRALAGGKVVQILNPEVLKHGTLLKAADGGNLGLVHDGKHIAHQLRFGDPKSVRTVAAPAAIWQIAGAVTLQYYLVRINQQLSAIVRRVSALRQEFRNKTYGVVMACAEGAAELEAHLTTGPQRRDEDLPRLIELEGRIDEAYHEIRKNLEDFAADAHATVGAFDTSDKTTLRDELAYLYEEASGTRAFDAQMLAFASVVRHKLNCIRLLLELTAADPQRADIVREQIVREADAMRTALGDAKSAFDVLDIPQDRLDERWFWGTPEAIRNAGGLEYSDFSKDLRTALRRVQSTALPPIATVDDALLLELRADDHGNLVVARAQIEPASNKRSPRPRRR